MQPNIRVKRYATRSRHVRGKPRRRGSAASIVLVVLIVIVAGLAVSVALSPETEQKPRKTTAARKPPGNEPAAAGIDETRSAEGTEAVPTSSEAATASAKPVSIASLAADPDEITPSALPSPGGDEGLNPSTTITLEMSRPAAVGVHVQDPNGSVVARLHNGPLEAGTRSFEWDGTYANGDQVSAGNYSVRAQVLSSSAKSERGTYLEAPLKAYSYITRGPRSRKAVALTIDDGWNPDMRIVEYLKKNKIPATAFLIAGRGVVDENPRFVRELIGARMEIANHTYEHAWLTDLDPDEVRQDIGKAQRMLTKISGYNHGWVRPSGGALNADVIQAAYDDGYHFVQWSIDSGDARGGAETETTLSEVGNGSIILTHFGGEGTYDYITEIVPALKKRGFKFVTVSELLGRMRIDQRTDMPPSAKLVRGLGMPSYEALAPLR